MRRTARGRFWVGDLGIPLSGHQPRTMPSNRPDVAESGENRKWPPRFFPTIPDNPGASVLSSLTLLQILIMSTVGFELEQVRQYIREQEAADGNIGQF